MDSFADLPFCCSSPGECTCVEQATGNCIHVAAAARVCQKVDDSLLEPHRFTRRELEVLLCMVDGKTDKQIADTLKLSQKTVQHHVRALFIKLKVKNRTQAAVRALCMGLIDMRSIMHGEIG